MILVFAFAAAGAAAASAPRSVHFVQTTSVLEAGRPAGPGIVSRVWVSGPRLRLEPGAVADGRALILRLDQGRGWRLDPERKVAVALDLESLRAQAHLDASAAADLMGAGEDASVRAVARSGVRTVAGRRCSVWRLSAATTTMEVCLAASVPVGMDAFADLLQWTGADASLGPLLDRLRELRGFPLETRSRVTILGEPHETLSTVTKVVVGPVDAALFAPPAGWRELGDDADEPEDPR
jgi:hypothetical protein